LELSRRGMLSVYLSFQLPHRLLLRLQPAFELPNLLLLTFDECIQAARLGFIRVI
jgi:hypothetical protein